MNELMIKNVDLFGNTVVAAKDNEGNIWAGVKWFCSALGLTRGQTNHEMSKIQSDIVLKEGCTKFRAGVFDQNNETIALKLEFVPLWLAKINITPSMQEKDTVLVNKLVNYQLKAKDVLAQAFLPSKEPTLTYQYPLPAATFESVANLGRLIERIMRSEGACPHEIAIVIKSIFQQAGIELPDCFIRIPAYEQISMTGNNGRLIYS